MLPVARPTGVAFIKVPDVGVAGEDWYGTIDDVAKHISPDAAVEWDRFVEENGIEVAKELRFTCVKDVWRAFHALEGAFIAQWWPDQGENGRWTTARTRARKPDLQEDRNDILTMVSQGQIDDLLTRDLDAKFQDPVREKRDAESEEFIRRRREGLCTSCGSEEGMLCVCHSR